MDIPEIARGEFHNAMMLRALEQAKIAAGLGEVPVGCVIVKGDEIISTGYNMRESKKNALCHAELIAIDKACQKLGGWRLHMCDLYVTLEPCPMCMGAIINARINCVVFGTGDPKAGCLGGIADFNSIAFNHHPQIIAGVMQQECSDVLKNFFADLRRKKPN